VVWTGLYYPAPTIADNVLFSVVCVFITMFVIINAHYGKVILMKLSE